MDPLIALAASALRSRVESLDMLANNLANATTRGFKADREFYTLYVAPEAAEQGNPTQPMVEKAWTDFSPGVMQVTGNQLDLAIDGKGFFGVNGRSGPLYTRNGAFRLLQDGTLATSDGYAVRAQGGGTIKTQSNQTLDISADGTVQQGGVTLGKIEVVDFKRTEALRKEGASYFRVTDPSVKPEAATGRVEQGKLEGSNAGAAEGAVRLVSVMRQFEMLQRAISLGGEMNRRVVEEVARVSG